MRKGSKKRPKTLDVAAKVGAKLWFPSTRENFHRDGRTRNLLVTRKNLGEKTAVAPKAFFSKTFQGERLGKAGNRGRGSEAIQVGGKKRDPLHKPSVQI